VRLPGPGYVAIRFKDCRVRHRKGQICCYNLFGNSCHFIKVLRQSNKTRSFLSRRISYSEPVRSLEQFCPRLPIGIRRRFVYPQARLHVAMPNLGRAMSGNETFSTYEPTTLGRGLLRGAVSEKNGDAVDHRIATSTIRASIRPGTECSSGRSRCCIHRGVRGTDWCQFPQADGADYTSR